MNALKGVGEKAEKELWPVFNKEVCSKGKSPGADDFPFLEKEVIMPLWSKANGQGLKLPPYTGEIQKLVHSIVKECAAAQKTNFCKKAELERMKGCAVSKIMSFVMGHLELSDKYGNQANCKIARKVLDNENYWRYAQSLVKNFAKKVT